MPVEPWPTVIVGGKPYWEVDIKARIAKESDPEAGVLFLVGTPNGGVGNFGPLVKGDPGVHAELDEAINFTALEPTDPTPDSASFTILTPPDDDTPGVYQLNLELHKGLKGDDGDTVVTPDDYVEEDGAALPGQALVVNGDSDGFILQSLPYGELYLPATINNISAGNPGGTLAVVSIPARQNNYRPIPFAYTIITGTGADVSVDLIARLNGETGGNIIGRCPGIAGAKDRLILVAGSSPGSADGYNKVNAGDPATVHFRTERQSGTETYTTSSSTTRCGVLVIDVP